MKTIIINSFLLSFVIPGYLFSQCKLEIEVTGLHNNFGPVLMELYTETHILVKHEKGQIKNDTCLIIFKGLNPAKYAIRYFHDENMNYKLDTNWAGIPIEGYGFSNNVLGKFGPPAFEKWIFELKENTKLRLKIKYQ